MEGHSKIGYQKIFPHSMITQLKSGMIYVRGSGGVGVPSSPISDRVVDDGRSLL